MIAAPVLVLTPEQRRIVEWGDGPVVVIAGAGTGKTRVIVERVRHLLATREDLLPEQILVLTYNVKAARELRDRLDATRRRRRSAPAIAVSQLPQLLPADPDRERRRCRAAGAPGRPRRRRPGPAAARHPRRRPAHLPLAVELVARRLRRVHQPGEGRAGQAGRVRCLRRRGAARVRGALRQLRGRRRAARRRRATWRRFASIRGAYAWRAPERARGEPRRGARLRQATHSSKAADREARRTVAGTGTAVWRNQIAARGPPADRCPGGDLRRRWRRARGAAPDRDGRRSSAPTRTSSRGAAPSTSASRSPAVTKLFKTRPNVLRRWQRQFRYILVDEFQDANVAQIELIEMLGRTPDRPDNVMVVGDDDQSIYRFRGASFAAFAEFDARFARPPAHDPDATPPGPPPRLRIEQNFRSVRNVLTAANRLIANNETRFEPDKRLTTDRPDGDPVELVVCAGAEDEAVAIVDAIKSMVGEGTGRKWTDVAVLYRKHTPPRGDRRAAARRGHPVHRRRRAEPVRHARDPRPRAGAPGDRRPARRRRAGPDDDRRSVAARCPRDPAGDPDGEVRSGAPARDRRGRSSRPGRSRSTSSTSGARTGPSTRRSMPRR